MKYVVIDNEYYELVEYDKQWQIVWYKNKDGEEFGSDIENVRIVNA